MAKTGIGKELWDKTSEKSGFALCPAGVGLEFRISKVTTGVTEDKKTGDEYEYLSVNCEYHDEDSERFIQSEFFALTEERLGFLKSFLRRIGRCDIMLDDAEWEDLVDTEFTADIRHTQGKKNGVPTTYANMEYQSIVAVSHDIFEIPEDDDLDAAIQKAAEENDAEEEVAEDPTEKTRDALKRAKSTDVAPKAAATKTSPRRTRRAVAPR